MRVTQRLSHFDFSEVAVAQRLTQLLGAGCSLRVIDRRQAEISRLLPGVERPLADPRVVTGRRLFLPLGDELAEPGGQLLFDFDERQLEDDAGESPATIAITAARRHGADESLESLVDRLQQEAIDWEDEGQLDRAAEAYRTMLMAAGPRARCTSRWPTCCIAQTTSLPRGNAITPPSKSMRTMWGAQAWAACSPRWETSNWRRRRLRGRNTVPSRLRRRPLSSGERIDRLGMPEEAVRHFEKFLELAGESVGGSGRPIDWRRSIILIRENSAKGLEAHWAC